MAQDIIARGLAIKALEEGGGGGGDRPVTSVNGKTVVLTAKDVKALPNTTKIPTKTSELTNDSEFTNKAYVDSMGSSTSPIVHDMYVTGNLSITGTASSTNDPVNGVDLVTKKYLDGRFSFDETTSTLTITI